MMKKRYLSVKQISVLGNLLCGKSISQAAQAAQTSEKTLRTWLKSDAAFGAALRDADHEAVAAISRRLAAMQLKALDTLEALMTDATHESVHRQAAVDCINLSLQYRKQVELTDRIIAVEAEVFKTNTPV